MTLWPHCKACAISSPSLRSIFHNAVAQFRSNTQKEAEAASLGSKTADAKGDAVDGNSAAKAAAKAKGNNRKYKVSATASQNGVPTEKVSLVLSSTLLKHA